MVHDRAIREAEVGLKGKGRQAKAAFRCLDYLCPLQLAAEQYFASLAYGVPALEQVPAGHGDPFSAHTPPEQLPLPFIRSAEAAVIKTTELKNANDNASTKLFISISSRRTHCECAMFFIQSN
jgi:hypothetical protein